MKRYAGDRTIDGIHVTVDGEGLDPRTDVAQFSSLGFEWTYCGPEPRQLALAILADHLNNDATALQLCEPFMEQVVASFDNTWEMTSNDVDLAIQGLS